MSRRMPRHGTFARYQREMKADGEACDACRQAAAVYQRIWRERTGNARGKALNRARSRALRRLKDRYPNVYRALLEEELAKEAQQ